MCGFADVDPGQWYYPYIASAADYGLIMGQSDKVFAPQDNITRQDLCVIIGRILQQKGYPLQGGDLPFTDADQIRDYAADSVSTMYALGLIQGMEDGSMAPMKTTTRAEAAVIISRLLDLIV